ncbi:hypothetical protein HDU96_004344 [Phlyctochytrium bullatum]|nr:hypothetical protein HDU96_004344 [Phlyctochytrium bullatum]
MRPLGDRKPGEGALALFLAHAVDAVCVMVVLGAVWQLAMTQPTLWALLKRNETETLRVMQSTSSWWKASVTKAPETQVGATEVPKAVDQKSASFWDIFAVRFDDEDEAPQQQQQEQEEATRWKWSQFFGGDEVEAEDEKQEPEKTVPPITRVELPKETLEPPKKIRAPAPEKKEVPIVTTAAPEIAPVATDMKKPVSDEPKKPAPVEEQTTPAVENVSRPRDALHVYFSQMEFAQAPSLRPPRTPKAFSHLPTEDQGLAKFLTAVKQAAHDGSKYAGDLLARWAQTEVLMAADTETAAAAAAPTDKTEMSLLQQILAYQDEPAADEGYEAAFQWNKLAEPVAPLLQALGDAARAGSASAAELLKQFFRSVVTPVAASDEPMAPAKTEETTGSLFANYFTIAQAIDAAEEADLPSEPSLAAVALKNFFEYLEAAARSGGRAARALVEDLLRAETEGRTRRLAEQQGPHDEGKHPREEQANLFTSFFVDENSQAPGADAENSAATAFLEYLYNAAKAGSVAAADLVAQWVGAAEETGKSDLLSRLLAPQEASTEVAAAADAQPKQRQGVFASFFADADDEAPDAREALHPSEYRRMLGEWLKLEDWGVPSTVRVALNSLFTSFDGDEDAEKRPSATPSAALISPKDTRQIFLFKKKLRELERRARARGESGARATVGERLTLRKFVTSLAKPTKAARKLTTEGKPVASPLSENVAGAAEAKLTSAVMVKPASVAGPAPTTPAASPAAATPETGFRWRDFLPHMQAGSDAAAQPEEPEETYWASLAGSWNLQDVLSRTGARSIAESLLKLAGQPFAESAATQVTPEADGGDAGPPVTAANVWRMFVQATTDQVHQVWAAQNAPEAGVAETPAKYVAEEPLRWIPGDPEPIRATVHGRFYEAAVAETRARSGETAEDAPVPPTPTSCLTGWYGLDPTFDRWCGKHCPGAQCSGDLCSCGRITRNSQVVCLDNRYRPKKGSQFQCQASCNQPPFLCPNTHCTCVHPEARVPGTDGDADRCTSPRRCKTAEYVAVPGAGVTNEWCAASCTAPVGDDVGGGGACPCTLCECAVTCGAGIPNGDFEGGLRAWTVVRQRGSRAATVVTMPSRRTGDTSWVEGLATVGGAQGKQAAEPGAGLVAPLSRKMIPAVPLARAQSSERVAVMDIAAPGSVVVYAEYTPKRGDVLKFRWAAVNWAKDFYIHANTTSAGVMRNQQFRVDIIDAKLANGSYNWFEWSTTASKAKSGAGAILATALQPDKARNLMNAIGEPPFVDAEPWQMSRFDLSPFAGRPLLVAFRAVANRASLSVVLDDVTVANDVCTPPSFAVGPRRLPDAVAVEPEHAPECGEVCAYDFGQ